jgi:hypothetical protein
MSFLYPVIANASYLGRYSYQDILHRSHITLGSCNALQTRISGASAASASYTAQ